MAPTVRRAPIKLDVLQIPMLIEHGGRIEERNLGEPANDVVLGVLGSGL